MYYISTITFNNNIYVNYINGFFYYPNTVRSLESQILRLVLLVGCDFLHLHGSYLGKRPLRNAHAQNEG